jgi:competence protein ComEA
MQAGGDHMKLRLLGKEAEIRTETAVIGISVLVLLGILIGYVFFRDTGDIIIEADAGGPAADGDASGNTGTLGDGGDAPVSAATEGSNPEEGVSEGGPSGGDASKHVPADKDNGKIKVYVVGCVARPGIVTIDKGGMICDAVREAGGLTEDADSDNINMVYSLNENVMLYIKSKKDESGGVGKGAVVVSDSGTGAAVVGENDDAAGKDKNKQVNINTAGIDELDTLPGIGEATARDIIAYRDKNGGFAAIEDIMKVPRIKENRFESIRDYITVE